MLNPLVVVRKGEGKYFLVAGGHRLEAANDLVLQLFDALSSSLTTSLLCALPPFMFAIARVRHPLSAPRIMGRIVQVPAIISARSIALPAASCGRLGPRRSTSTESTSRRTRRWSGASSRCWWESPACPTRSRSCAA
jgi:hypothetical protein